MTVERLMHFSSEPVTAVRDIIGMGREGKRSSMKPRGLWVSVEGNGDGWSDWCAGESYPLGDIPHVVTLASAANILWLKSPEQIDDFTAEYRGEPLIRSHPEQAYHIDWASVGEKYQGIMITPYQWSRRLDDVSSWYYSWDCASGCIWGAEAIERIDRAHDWLPRATEAAE